MKKGNIKFPLINRLIQISDLHSTQRSYRRGKRKKGTIIEKKEWMGGLPEEEEQEWREWAAPRKTGWRAGGDTYPEKGFRASTGLTSLKMPAALWNKPHLPNLISDLTRKPTQGRAEIFLVLG